MGVFDFLNPKRRKAAALAESLVRRGLGTLEEIAGEVEAGAEVSASEAKTIVAEAWRSGSAKAPAAPTSLDRLDACFGALEATGILARHYPEAGRSEAYDFAYGELAEAVHRGKAVRGFAFYDRHSVEMMEQRALALSFGGWPQPRTYRQLWSQNTAVGQAVAEALKKSGFRVEWNGDHSTVIVVAGCEWVGRRDAEGAPILKTGPKLPVRAVKRDAKGAPVTSIFVGCDFGMALGHALLGRIGEAMGVAPFGDADAVAPAAVDVDLASGRTLDFVAGATRHPDGPARYLLGTRDLAGECGFLVEVAGSASAPGSAWWSNYRPEDRLLVVHGETAETVEGSKAVSATADDSGTRKIIAAVEAATAR